MATVPAEITWTTGQVVTAAQLNTNMRDAVNFIIAPPLAVLRQTVAQSLTSAVYTALAMDTEDIDRDNAHSTVTNTSRYTAQTTGWYDHDGSYAIGTNGTGRRAVHWGVNATAVNGGEAVIPATAAGGVSVAAPGKAIFLNVGDFSELFAYQDSGGPLNTAVSPASQMSSSSIRWRST